MSTVTRNLSNIDGANVTNPDANSFTSNGLSAYASDAAFEAVTTPVAGSIYWNTTEKLLREYNGTSWQYDKLSVSTVTDSATTGADQDITPSISDQIIRYTQGSLASIRSIAPTTQRVLWLINDQASSGITLKNEDGAATAANRIRTGNGQNFLLQTNQVVGLAYDDEISRWRIVSRDVWGLEAFANDAAYESAHGPVFTGSRYWNTTELVVREYDGTAWQNNKVLLSLENNTALTGGDQDVTPGRDQIIKLSNASLTSIRGIIPSVQKFLILINGTGAAITVKDENGTATAANRVITGTGTDLSLSDKASILCAYDTNSSRWRVVGGTGTGTSSASSFINYFADPGFETGVDSTLPSGWLQYNDGAVAVPVDGAGGAANSNVTFLITSSGPIRGLKSAVITKGPGNQQGTGYSYLFTIANPDKGVLAGVDFELVTSSDYVSGDMVLYIYDVTNSLLITPRAVSIPALTNYGKFFSSFGLTEGTQYRLILHIATTNANPWTMTLDTMTNTTTRVAVPGAAVGNSETYVATTPNNSLNSTPTLSTQNIQFQRIGPIIDVMGYFTTGTCQAAQARLSLPAGMTVDTIGGGSAITVVGRWEQAISTAATIKSGPILATAGTNYINFGTDDTANGQSPFTAQNANTQLASATKTAIRFTVPISELAGSGTNLGPGAQEQFLYNSSGTTAAGVSDALAFAYGPTGAAIGSIASTTGSSSVTTMRVRSQYPLQQTGTQILVEIYDGQAWFDAAGRFPYVVQGASIYGIRAIGVNATDIDVQFGNKGCLPSNATYAGDGTAWSAISTQRWRVRVVNASSPVGFGLVTAEASGLLRGYLSMAKIRLHTGNGYGSTNTVIRRFLTTVVNTGTGITYADSATLGTSLTCTEAGIYSFTYNDLFSAASNFGLSLNSSQLTTSIINITAADRLVNSSVSGAGEVTCVSVTLALSVGDVVRPHGSGTTDGGAPSRATFVCQRIA